MVPKKGKYCRYEGRRLGWHINMLHISSEYVTRLRRNQTPL